MPADPDDWTSKTEGKGQKWKQNADSSEAEQNYREGLADYLGISEGDVATDQTWRDQVGRVSASDFDSAIAGKGDKWARNFERGVTQG